jgi:adenylate kinase family enzyme
MVRRVHILGASGSGTTALAKDIEDTSGFTHLDTDSFFWMPTNPPFTTPRERTARQDLLRDRLEAKDAWVLSGSLCGWGDFAIPLFDLAVFLWVPADIRVQRLRSREIERYGRQIENPSDPRYGGHKQFLEWAVAYDSGGLDMRSRVHHEQWMKTLPCTLLRIEGDHSSEESLTLVLTHIAKNEPSSDEE